MKKIAIVGCGWLGFPLAQFLKSKGHFILGTTTSNKKLPQLNSIGIQSKIWSLTGFETITSTSFLHDMDVVVVNIPPSKYSSEKLYSDALANFGALLPSSVKVLYISTTGVYPETEMNATENYTFSENDLTKQTVLAEIKLRKVLLERLTILRLAGLFGPNRHPVKFLAGKINLPHGNAPLNLIHLNDVIRLIEQIITVNYWGEILNGCYPNHPSKKEYYEKAAVFYKLQVPKFLDGGELFKKISSHKSITELKFKYENSIFNLESID